MRVTYVFFTTVAWDPVSLSPPTTTHATTSTRTLNPTIGLTCSVVLTSGLEGAESVCVQPTVERPKPVSPHPLERLDSPYVLNLHDVGNCVNLK